MFQPITVLIALAIWTLVKRPMQDQNTVCSIWVIPHVLDVWWGEISDNHFHGEFDSVAWHDLCRPWNVWALGLGYITTSIFMIITSKCVITLSIWSRPPVFVVCCQQPEWMQFGDLGSIMIKPTVFAHIYCKSRFSIMKQRSLLW